jgi:hypothetical protein
MVDDEDLPVIVRTKWHCTIHGYAARRSQEDKIVYMHRQIAAPGSGLTVDHINGNKLDNQRVNLRICSRLGQARNARGKSFSRHSRFKGVCKTRDGNKWRATITVNWKQVSLGSFDTELEAALAYDAAARELHSEFAKPNFPTPEEAARGTTSGVVQVPAVAEIAIDGSRIRFADTVELPVMPLK